MSVNPYPRARSAELTERWFHRRRSGSAASTTCRYVAEWTAVKIRWRLTVDSAEKSALTSIAAGCTNVTITVTQAI